MRFVLALAALAFALRAQTPPEKAVLAGQVVNAVTSEPVRRVLVYARRIDSMPGTTNIYTTQSVLTDTAGHFALNGLDAGAYRITAERNGFLTAQYGARAAGKSGVTVALSAGQKMTDLSIPIYPHGVITGRVLDEEGDPVPNANVELLRMQYMQGRKQLAHSNGGSTNDLGEYRLFGVAPGRYYLSATFRGNPNGVNPVAQEDYVPTFYPRTWDAAAAAPLEMAAGAQLRNIDIMLARQHTVTVRGRVVNEAPGSSNVNVILSAHNPFGGSGNSRGALVNPQGGFEFKTVVPGNYVLVAMANVPGKAYTARIPVQVAGADIDNLAITIYAPLTIEGRVTIDGDTSEKLGNLHVALGPFEAGNTVYGPLPDSAVRRDGGFQLSDVSAEHYSVNVYGVPEGLYVKSVRSSQADVLMTGLDLTSGAAAPLTIVLAPNAGQLTGTVLDSNTQKPVPAATVVLVPQDKARRTREFFYRTAPTDNAGHFTVKSIVPGDYKVFSWEGAAYGAWMDPEFLAQYESAGQSVTVTEGSPQSLQLNLIPE